MCWVNIEVVEKQKDGNTLQVEGNPSFGGSEPEPASRIVPGTLDEASW